MTNNYQISSNWTLVHKMFFPTMWLSFFGVFNLALFFYPMDDTFIFSTRFKLTFLLGFIIFFLLMYFTVFRLKRVEFNPESWTTTNYLKTFQYKYEDIHKISITHIGLMRIATIHLKTKGSFGKKLPIILNKQVLDQFLNDYPELITAPIGRAITEDK